jgi:hypothetical protein
MKRKITTTLLSCAALAAFTPSLHAATSLLDTTSASLNSSGGISLGGLAFSTGSQAYSLDSFQFAPVNPFGSGDASLTFRLYSADASTHLPTSTSALASETFSNILFDVSATPTQVTFTNNFTLEANSSYVLEFSATGLEDGSLATTNPFPANVSVGTSGVTYHGYTWNFGSWSEPAAGLAPWVKLTGTAVPEPSAFVMLGLGAIGLVARRRRVG